MQLAYASWKPAHIFCSHIHILFRVRIHVLPIRECVKKLTFLPYSLPASSISVRSPECPPCWKKACKGKGKGSGGKGKGSGGRGKGKEKASDVWSTADPGTTYPDFSHNFGPTVELPYDAAPVDYIMQVYPPQLIDLLVEQTNL